MKQIKADVSPVDKELLKQGALSESAVTEIITVYTGMVKALAAKYAFNPSDADDFMQEGFLGLLSAIRTYSPDKEVKFSTYAAKCIQNKILTALAKCRRHNDNENIFEYAKEIQTDFENPEKIVASRFEAQEIYDKLHNNLSQFERDVFIMFLNGYSYDRMANELNVSKKAIDNAVQRGRNKLKTLLKTND